MSTITHFVGNTAPALTYILKTVDDSGVVTPFPIPAGATARFYLREAGTDTFRVDGAAATIVNPAATLPTDTDAVKLRYDWDAADVALPTGEFVGYFRVTFSDGSTQDTPAFTWILADHSTSAAPVGTYITVAQLKDFTGFDELKAASDEWLATNVIPRAEAWLQAWGPFVSTTCPALKLGALVLAEGLFARLNPSAANRAAAGGYKSESIGNYSYTLKDAATTGSEDEWTRLMDEISNIVSVCQAEGAGEIVYGSTQVFTPLPGYAIDSDGTIAATFNVNAEIALIRGYLDYGTWPWWRNYP